MALIPLHCPACSHTTSLPASTLDVRTVAGTDAAVTTRWRCRYCERSVVICLNDEEWAYLRKAPGLHATNVDCPVIDSPEWPVLTEEEAIEVMAELHALPEAGAREEA